MGAFLRIFVPRAPNFLKATYLLNFSGTNAKGEEERRSSVPLSKNKNLG
jgi:hypothetical protein